MRLYFYEKTANGLQQLDCKFNGMVNLGNGAMVKDANGEYVKGTTGYIEGAKFADSYKIIGERVFTAKDFPGKTIVVKCWYPKEHDAETEYLELA